MSYEKVTKYIDFFIDKFNKEKYFIDLSGRGEPLLELPLILKIKEYCVSKSNLIKKEILVSFVTNGTLLTSNIAKILQENQILFGVSIDGDRLTHNMNRFSETFRNSYEIILKI